MWARTLFKNCYCHQNLGLEIGNLRGQGYDGAGNIAGKKVVYRAEF